MGLHNLCEIKYTGKEFLIDKDYAENLRKKMAVYHSVTRTKDQLVLSFVTSVGLAESKYRQGLVWSETTLPQLFE